MSRNMNPCPCGITEEDSDENGYILTNILVKNVNKYYVLCYSCKKQGPYKDTYEESVKGWNLMHSEKDQNFRQDRAFVVFKIKGKDGEGILAQEHYLMPKKYQEFEGKFNFFGGAVEKDETLLQAVTREVEEEIDIPRSITKKLNFTHKWDLNKKTSHYFYECVLIVPESILKVLAWDVYEGKSILFIKSEDKILRIHQNHLTYKQDIETLKEECVTSEVAEILIRRFEELPAYAGN